MVGSPSADSDDPLVEVDVSFEDPIGINRSQG